MSKDAYTSCERTPNHLLRFPLLTKDRVVADVPLQLLRAELARRDNGESDRPPCGSNNKSRHYNTGLHVFALFLILVLSTFACSFPLIVRRFPRLPVPNYSLFLSRHFGTGVLIATAFVHLLPTAYVNLTDLCLPPFWNETYPPMAGFVAMVSVMIVVGLEMFFAAKGARHNHGGLDLESSKDGGDDKSRRERPGYKRASGSFKPFRQVPLGAAGHHYDEDETIDNDEATPTHSQRSPYSDSPGSVDKPLPLPPKDPVEDEEDESDLELDELEEQGGDDTRLLNGTSDHRPKVSPNGHPRPSQPRRTVSFAEPLTSSIAPDSPTTTHANEQRLVLQCLLLEAGILFHSVFIGMALSVSTGPAFIVLLIAISFHQTFEGLALGSRIAAIPSFSTTSLKPWAMSAMYGITTPIGQAIGLAVHTLYDPESQFGLLTVGIVNAISSGLLLYAGLVQLLAEDFLSDQSYIDLQGRRRLEASGAVVAGSMLMAFVGACKSINRAAASS